MDAESPDIHALRVRRIQVLQRIKELQHELFRAQVEALEIEAQGRALVMQQRKDSLTS